VDDYPPRNRHREDWDFLEGRGTPPPGTNVVKFPVSPAPHLATSQRIAAEAGIVPTTVEPTPEPVISDERGMSLLVRLTAHLTGYGKPPKEPWER
jgi:hypothetical protein